MEKIPFTVIGSGICGVLVAKKLLQTFPGADVLVLDKEPYAGHHNTTRNSGVLHAGIYYPNKSLKHTLCIKGHAQWIQLSKQLDIPIDICGKYVIASDESERPELEKYFQNALLNQVPDVRKMTEGELKEIENATTAVDGFYSPHTGILDISSAINTLFDELSIRGAITMLETEVLSVSQQGDDICVETTRDKFLTSNLINCAGMDAVSLRKMLSLSDIEYKFVKGNYLKLNRKFYNDKLIYPVPQKDLKGLGVHTSFHMDKIIRFGPNTEDVAVLNYQNKDENI